VIQIGNVRVDITKVEELQGQVDQGHQPWRLNSCVVAEVEAREYGFTAQDIESLICSEPSDEIQRENNGAVIRAEIRHNGQLYSLTIGQPLPGTDKIWRVHFIGEK
jgi:hypothetical protein